jgi:DNA-binding IclR family transcriptional regulator
MENAGELWTPQELGALTTTSRSTIYRELKKLSYHDIISKVGSAYTLNPFLVSDLSLAKSKLTKIKHRMETTNE